MHFIKIGAPKGPNTHKHEQKSPPNEEIWTLLFSIKHQDADNITLNVWSQNFTAKRLGIVINLLIFK